MKEFIVVESTFFNSEKTRKSYGIALIEEGDESFSVLDSIIDIDQDIGVIQRLVELCNDHDLSPDHLHEFIDDYLSIGDLNGIDSDIAFSEYW